MTLLKKIFPIIASRPVMASLAIIGVLLPLLWPSLYQPKPHIRFEILTNTVVSDTYRNLSKLDISYGGVSLRSQNLALRIITFRIVNSGNRAVQISDYDSRDPLGFKVAGGKRLFDVFQHSASNAYLRHNVELTVLKDNRVSISPVILSPNDFIEIKLVVLVPEGQDVSIEPTGKIAGIDAIDIVSLYSSDSDKSLLTKATEGGPIVQLIRVPFYFVSFLLLMVGIALLISPIIVLTESISNKRRKVRRREQIRSYRKGKTLSPQATFVLDQYENSGSFPSEFDAYCATEEKNNKIRKILLGLNDDDTKETFQNLLEARRKRQWLDDLLAKERFQTTENNLLQIDPSLKAANKEFLTFLHESSSA